MFTFGTELTVLGWDGDGMEEDDVDFVDNEDSFSELEGSLVGVEDGLWGVSEPWFVVDGGNLEENSEDAEETNDLASDGGRGSPEEVACDGDCCWWTTEDLEYIIVAGLDE